MKLQNSITTLLHDWVSFIPSQDCFERTTAAVQFIYFFIRQKTCKKRLSSRDYVALFHLQINYSQERNKLLDTSAVSPPKQKQPLLSSLKAGIGFPPVCWSAESPLRTDRRQTGTAQGSLGAALVPAENPLQGKRRNVKMPPSHCTSTRRGCRSGGGGGSFIGISCGYRMNIFLFNFLSCATIKVQQKLNCLEIFSLPTLTLGCAIILMPTLKSNDCVCVCAPHASHPPPPTISNAAMSPEFMKC